MLEQTKTKLINLANQQGQFSDSIKIWSNYMQLTQSTKKRVRTSHNWLGFTSDWMKKWRQLFFSPIV